MPFEPPKQYQIIPDKRPLFDFHHYADEIVTRPPYQRKTVWSAKKKQSLLDSILRGYYIPKLVLRRVKLGESRYVDEVVDGQQRITTVQSFFNNELALPKSLGDIHDQLPGKKYADLDSDIKRFVDTQKFDVDIINNIEDPLNPDHQRLATEVFWRLQQGESLNEMEIAHARLSSLGRNFLVKYADDITFDFEHYTPVDSNPSKHSFFKILNRPNTRMQHLAILGRMVLLEQHDGATDLRDAAIVDWIESKVDSKGIGNDGFEKDGVAKETLSTLNLLHSLFKDDPMAKEGDGIQELKPDYVVLSLFMLARHVRKNYVLDPAIKRQLYEFYIAFHERYRTVDLTDTMMAEFKDSRQHSRADVRTRELIIRQAFFEYLASSGSELHQKDTKRAFNESQRIAIYRADKGQCQACLAEGKSPEEAEVSWQDYEADHILAHAKGGATDLPNGQVLCRPHNRSKSDS